MNKKMAFFVIVFASVFLAESKSFSMNRVIASTKTNKPGYIFTLKDDNRFLQRQPFSIQKLEGMPFSVKFKSENKEGIYQCDSSHYDAIKKIAFQHGPELFQFYRGTNEKLFEHEFDTGIKPDLKKGNARVYIKDGEPVGFVTYDYGKSLILYLLNIVLGWDINNGIIRTLAVDKEYQKNGYGKQLMEHVLDDFQNNKKVHKVRLCTIKDVDDNLKPFYGQFGFEQGRTSKSCDWATLYVKRNTPNLWIESLKKMVTFFEDQ